MKAESLLVRGIGVVFLIAFLSLSTQILGLVGGEGILPAEGLFQAVAERFGNERFWIFPSLCWFSTSDPFILFLCYGGAVLSVLLMLGVFPPIILPFLWVFYLSLVTVGGEFLEFQWDNLLLESVFVSLPLALAPTNKWALLLSRLLLFKLMFSSGLVKLASGDPVWRDLTALTYHYWSQPLPNFISWYIHQLPLWFHKISCLLMFAVELIVPFFFFGPRALRLFAFFTVVGFQLVILLTGNYGFFNLLAIVLGLSLLLELSPASKEIPSPLRSKQETPQRGGKLSALGGRSATELAEGQGEGGREITLPPTPSPPGKGEIILRRLGVCFFLFLFLLVSAVQMSGIVVGRRNIPGWAAEVVSVIAPFRTINRYGLFAVMTKGRREIMIEGSEDGVNWKEYEFRWKPGDVMMAPKFLVGHMPRLDWQMWFAALGDIRGNSWVNALLYRLAEGSKEVEGLVARIPFREGPPRFLRAVVYDYRFTDTKVKGEAGEWWTRNPVGQYSPVISRSGEVSPQKKED